MASRKRSDTAIIVAPLVVPRLPHRRTLPKPPRMSPPPPPQPARTTTSPAPHKSWLELSSIQYLHEIPDNVTQATFLGGSSLHCPIHSELRMYTLYIGSAFHRYAIGNCGREGSSGCVRSKSVATELHTSPNSSRGRNQERWAPLNGKECQLEMLTVCHPLSATSLVAFSSIFFPFWTVILHLAS